MYIIYTPFWVLQVMRQLLSSGILDAVRVRKMGYGRRLLCEVSTAGTRDTIQVEIKHANPHIWCRAQEFARRYALLLPPAEEGGLCVPASSCVCVFFF
jgi:hypothetical protein